MFVTRGNLLFNICLILTFFEFNEVKPETGTDTVDADGTVKDVASIVQSPLTKAMCKLKTVSHWNCFSKISFLNFIARNDVFLTNYTEWTFRILQLHIGNALHHNGGWVYSDRFSLHFKEKCDGKERASRCSARHLRIIRWFFDQHSWTSNRYIELKGCDLNIIHFLFIKNSDHFSCTENETRKLSQKLLQKLPQKLPQKLIVFKIYFVQQNFSVYPRWCWLRCVASELPW